jgi:hypothetical protein
VRRPGYRGRLGKRLRSVLVFRLKQGAARSVDGSWAGKVDVIDRERDRRAELVIGEDGTILHYQDRPLSEHLGHGSDREKAAPPGDNG